MIMSELIRLVELHSERLQEDLLKCTTREDHIRVTARATEAVNILHGLQAILDDES